MRIPKFKPLADLIKKHPAPAANYRVYDMRNMRGWGNSAFWWPSASVGEKACIFGRTPKVGDVLVSDSTSGEGLAFVIVDVDTPRDPGDQHFVKVARWGRPSDLPEPVKVNDRREDWV